MDLGGICGCMMCIRGHMCTFDWYVGVYVDV